MRIISNVHYSGEYSGIIYRSMAFQLKSLSETPLGRFSKHLYKKCLNIVFYLKFYKYKKVKKIIYALTPTSNLSNLGDHAQAVAITQWLKDYFEDYSVLEFNIDDVYKYVFSIKKIVTGKDLIILQSGGNLGDRGIWSENARRLIIQNFPNNKIISLPQTIFFSDTSKGRKELGITKTIYNNHKNLTIIARDEHSYSLAKKYFPQCEVLLFPDFVLYLEPHLESGKKREKVLLCLRRDNESSIDEEAKNFLIKSIKDHNEEYDEYDTTLDRNIFVNARDKELHFALDYFKQHKLVITDRFHGIIFSVITRTPCIAMKTVDHKLTESVKWFKGLSSVFFINKASELPQIISKALNVVQEEKIEWRSLYFKDLKEIILSS